MANITSSTKRRKHRGNGSFVPDPVRMRPLRYKTAMRLAFEPVLEALGVPAEVIAATPGGMKTTATWVGTRAA